MSRICPVGHMSQSTDYCDVCGAPMTAVAPTPAAPGPSAAATQQCPHCGVAAPGDALFCESCGYDFTTGALPLPVVPLDLSTGAMPTVAPAVVSAPAPTAPAGPSGAADPAPSSAPPVPAGVPVWVAELWVDPDWYRHQPVPPEDPLPSVGLPRVLPLRVTSVLVGRPSRSRGITPEVDCSPDSGVSRRHCQLTTDGHRWWVEDLQSSNGTFLQVTGGPLPDDPITPGERRELAGDDRLFVGGWTRIQLREAQPGES